MLIIVLGLPFGCVFAYIYMFSLTKRLTFVKCLVLYIITGLNILQEPVFRHMSRIDCVW